MVDIDLNELRSHNYTLLTKMYVSQSAPEGYNKNITPVFSCRWVREGLLTNS
jgi:hypothetical protein